MLRDHPLLPQYLHPDPQSVPALYLPPVGFFTVVNNLDRTFKTNVKTIPRLIQFSILIVLNQDLSTVHFSKFQNDESPNMSWNSFRIGMMTF